MKFEGMSHRIAALPRDQRGYPVPWFVAWFDGVPDFRVIDASKVVRAVQERRCFICGDILGRHLAFTIGPMCAINRISSEPPSHRDCSIFAAKHCPFLTNPAAPRRETHMPDGRQEPGGIHLARNPGVALVWNTDSYKLIRVDGNRERGIERGVLFEMGPPTECLWFAEGRQATREEVMASIESGYPSLLELAQAEGLEAVRALEEQAVVALQLVPMGKE